MTETDDTFDFSGERFDGDRAVSAIAQIANPQKSNPNFWGLVVDQSHADHVGLSVPDSPEWDIQQRQTNLGDKPVYVCKAPRILILATQALMMKHRHEGHEVVFDRNEYDQDSSVWRVQRRAAILLCDRDNNLLHEVPLRLFAAGVACANFFKGYEGFKSELLGEYVKLTGDSRPKGALFFAHGIYAPQFEVELVGQGSNKSQVCKTTGYEQPNFEHLGKHLLSTTTAASRLICNGLLQQGEQMVKHQGGDPHNPNKRALESQQLFSDAIQLHYHSLNGTPPNLLFQAKSHRTGRRYTCCEAVDEVAETINLALNAGNINFLVDGIFDNASGTFQIQKVEPFNPAEIPQQVQRQPIAHMGGNSKDDIPF